MDDQPTINEQPYLVRQDSSDLPSINEQPYLVRIEGGGDGGGTSDDLTLANFRNGVVVTNIRNQSQATNNNIATELAIRNAIDNAILGTFKIQGNKDTEAEILALTGSEDYEAWICLENGKLYYWLTDEWLSVQLVDINSFINNTNGIMVVSVMPAATADNKDYTYFYIGETAGDFKTKTFYKCVEVTPATDPKTYTYTEYLTGGDIFYDCLGLDDITDKSDQIIYRVDRRWMLLGRTTPADKLPLTKGYHIEDETVIQKSSTGLTINGTTYTWANLTDEILNDVSSAFTETTLDDYTRGTFKTNFTNNYYDFVFVNNGFGNPSSYLPYNNNRLGYALYYLPTVSGDFVKIGAGDGTNDYAQLENRPSIDNVTLVKGQTHQDLGLISKDDIQNTITTPQANGVDIVLDDGQNVDPSIIQDGIDYQYADNKTSSNKKIWTKIDEVERKADAKTNTRFVEELPDPVEANTEYYVETATENVYQRYFVDSTLTVKNLGTTQMDVSTLLSKQEATELYIPKANLVTDLEETVDNTKVSGAQAIKDYVDDHGGMLVEAETTLWSGSQGQGSNITITLSDGLSNYKYLKFYSTKSTNWMIDEVSVSDIDNSTTSNMIILENGWDSNLRYVRFYKLSNTQIMLENIVDTTLTKIVGVKASPRHQMLETEFTLWSGNQSAADDLTLSDSIGNYDYFLIYAYASSSTTNKFTLSISRNDLETLYTSNNSGRLFPLSWGDSRMRWVHIYRISDTKIRYNSNDATLTKIVGVKRAMSSSLDFKYVKIAKTGSFTPGSWTITGTIPAGYKAIAACQFGTEGVVGAGYVTTFTTSGQSVTCQGWWGYVNGSSPASTIWVQILCMKI